MTENAFKSALLAYVGIQTQNTINQIADFATNPDDETYETLSRDEKFTSFDFITCAIACSALERYTALYGDSCDDEGRLALHIFVDDGNLETGHINHCRTHALSESHFEGVSLCDIFLAIPYQSRVLAYISAQAADFGGIERDLEVVARLENGRLTANVFRVADRRAPPSLNTK